LKQSKPNLPTITCRCGFEILLLPDSKMMGKAIEGHVEEHRRKLKGQKTAEVDTIADELIIQALTKACEV
jgi:hypothetical protein